MQDTEQTHAGDEQRDDGENPAQRGEGPPHEDEELAREFAETFLQ